jgi:hypothetical protein
MKNNFITYNKWFNLTPQKARLKLTERYVPSPLLTQLLHEILIL